MKLDIFPTKIPAVGSLTDEPLVGDRREFVLRLSVRGSQAIELLNQAQSYAARREPENRSSYIGVDSGFAIVKLLGVTEQAFKEFNQEVENTSDIEAVLPLIRDRKGLAHIVIPREAILGFKNTIHEEEIRDLMEKLEVSNQEDLGANSFRVKLKPGNSPFAFVNDVNKLNAIEFADVSIVGSLIEENDKTLPSNTGSSKFFIRRDTFLLALNKTPSNKEVEELTSGGAINILGSYLEEIPEGDSTNIPQRIAIQSMDDSESETVISEMENLTFVDNVYPALMDEEGFLRFADYQEIVVVLKDKPNSEIWRNFAQENDLNILTLDEIGHGALLRSNTPALFELLNKLEQDPRVDLVEPAFLSDEVEASSLRENQLIPSQLWNHEIVSLSDAWTHSQGSGVVVAVVDKLADLNHNELKAALLDNKGLLSFLGDAKPQDHGTHVMGIIAGQKLSTGLIIGVAPAAKILPVAISTSRLQPYFERAKALNFLAEVARQKRWVDESNSIDISAPRLVVNCSWSTTGDQGVIKKAIASLVEAGALVCCSAGNENLRDAPHYPSDYPGVLSVASIDKNGQKSPFSNHGSRIDLCAPGGDDIPTDNGDIWSTIRNSKYGYQFGTSMASPHTAGVAALVWSLLPSATAQDVIKILRDTCIPIDGASLSGMLGSGRINAAKAVQKALSIKS